jgi:hypothetical protein
MSTLVLVGVESSIDPKNTDFQTILDDKPAVLLLEILFLTHKQF